MKELSLPIAVLVFLLAVVHLDRTTTQSTAVAPSSTDATALGHLPRSQGIRANLRITIPATAATATAPAAPSAVLAVWVEEPPAGTPLRGTVVFLHGFMANHNYVANAAEALCKAGYRSVNVDMRGFGKSTGSHMDFGVTDARDLQYMVTHLQGRGLCGAKVGVYGTSMGAATAILWAAIDPRVATVVAVAPYADIRAEVPSFARNVLGALGALFPDERLNEAADAVGAVAQWDLDSARPVDAIKKTSIPILLIHGDKDTIVPHAASEQLHAASPANTRLLTVRDRGHIDLCLDYPGELQKVTREWFNETLMPR